MPCALPQVINRFNGDAAFWAVPLQGAAFFILVRIFMNQFANFFISAFSSTLRK